MHQKQHIAMNRERATQRREAKKDSYIVYSIYGAGVGPLEWELSDSRKDGRVEIREQTEKPDGETKRMGLNIEIIRREGKVSSTENHE